MKQRAFRTALLAAAAAAPLVASVPTAAQWYGEPVLPPHAIVRMVTRQGFAGVAPPRLAGDVYIVDARTHDGARVRLVVDAIDGRIIPSERRREVYVPERVRPRAWPPAEYEIEREVIVRRPSRYADPGLVPPRSVGRGPARGSAEEFDDEIAREELPPVRGPVVREERAIPRAEPAPGRNARLEPPTQERVAPVKPEAPKAAAKPSPAPAVAAPAKPEQPATGAAQAAKPETPTAAPAPQTAKSDQAPVSAPTTPAAVSAPESVKKQAPVESASPLPAPDKAVAAPASQGASTTTEAKVEKKAEPGPEAPPAKQAQAEPVDGAPAGKVRVIGGVTPIQPQVPGTGGTF